MDRKGIKEIKRVAFGWMKQAFKDVEELAYEEGKKEALIENSETKLNGGKMEIKTLKDIKQALKDVPEDVLDSFGVGVNEDGDVCLMAWEGEDPMQYWVDHTEKYPSISAIDEWIRSVVKFVDVIKKNPEHDTFGHEEPISTKDFEGEKPSSSSFPNREKSKGDKNAE